MCKSEYVNSRSAEDYVASWLISFSFESHVFFIERSVKIRDLQPRGCKRQLQPWSLYI